MHWQWVASLSWKRGGKRVISSLTTGGGLTKRLQPKNASRVKLQLVEPEKEGKVISSNRLGEKGMRRSELLGQRKYETGSNHQIQSQWSLSVPGLCGGPQYRATVDRGKEWSLPYRGYAVT